MIQNYKRLGKFSINIRWRHSFIAMQDTCDSYCQNGGTCSHSPNGTSRSCTCGPRFSGETCETDLCADQCVAYQGKQILFFCCLFCFFLNFRRTWLLLAGALIPLFRTSADISSGFQNQCGSLTCMLCHMNAMISDSPLGGQHGSRAVLFHVQILFFLSFHLKQNCWNIVI